MKRPRTRRGYRNPARYRLEFIKENTLNVLWSVRMTPLRVWLVSGLIIAAVGALIWLVMSYTPLRRLVPGTLSGDLRARYIELSLTVDSLEQRAAASDAYLANIQTILTGDIPESSPADAPLLAASDSLLAASEAERAFVQKFEEQERFNLSVLAPIAAEGMVFTTPGNVAEVRALPGAGRTVELVIPRGGAVNSVYRGTVVSVVPRPDGMSDITIQHPNDFLTVYSGVRDVFVEKGSKVVAGQRIAHAGSAPISFELWHKESALDSREYISL